MKKDEVGSRKSEVGARSQKNTHKLSLCTLWMDALCRVLLFCRGRPVCMPLGIANPILGGERAFKESRACPEKPAFPFIQ